MGILGDFSKAFILIQSLNARNHWITLLKQQQTLNLVRELKGFAGLN